MRLPNLVRVSGGALLLSLLSGCVPTDAVTSPDPTPTFVAPYATDEEALAAAEAAYAEYVKVSGEILRAGGADSERIRTVTTGQFATDSIEGIEQFNKLGRHSVGAATFDDIVLQRYSSGGGDLEIITIYVCHDVSRVDVLNADGTSAVHPDRRDRTRMEATFDFDRPSNTLKLSTREDWADPDC